jgi:hypothetical protein
MTEGSYFHKPGMPNSKISVKTIPIPCFQSCTGNALVRQRFRHSRDSVHERYRRLSTFATDQDACTVSRRERRLRQASNPTAPTASLLLLSSKLHFVLRVEKNIQCINAILASSGSS